MRVPRAVARFNRRITNPMAVSFGGWAPLQGTLEHVGRKSGKSYRTPLNIFETDDGFVIPIGYGLESHWVQNVFSGWPGERSQARQDGVGRQPSADEQGRGHVAGGAQVSAVVPSASVQRGRPGVDRELGRLGDGQHFGAGQTSQNLC